MNYLQVLHHSKICANHKYKPINANSREQKCSFLPNAYEVFRMHVLRLVLVLECEAEVRQIQKLRMNHTLAVLAIKVFQESV